MMKKRNITLLTAFAAAAAFAPTAQAALSLANPSFESPERDGAFPGGVQPSDWTVDLAGKGGNAIEIESRWGG